ncbi:hypothetical protein IE077_001026 [Cardiosporidium cionae]|uniref:Phosphotransferase n=1 Tax=Cardiosporidium cionae TaxID=476202 RepID=A0ABQ7JDL0_9APIC|nr:hypothetical protein IE077_001026 [Cardiosporidium cionae]|eukprot:KAF8822113.1 hypothetical protein IE077_001026 [Cardiosporidium cionae]
MSSNRILPESLVERVASLCSAFSPDATVQQTVVEAVENEIIAGLNAHSAHPGEWREEDCSLMMLDSWVKAIPSGSEKTITYALDLGGTNARFLRLVAKGNGVVEEKIKIQNIREVDDKKYPDGMLDRRVTASKFFDYFAQSLHNFMKESGDLDDFNEEEKEVFKLSFSFSFACQQKSLTHADLLFWTKGFFTGMDTEDPVEKRDVGALMAEALKRNSVPMELVALVNDTVGTLVSGAYQKPSNIPACLIGVIIGTGFNICYYEENAQKYEYSGKVINMEMGSFNKALPYTIADIEVDWFSNNPGSQKLEKMISGMLLGDIVRRAVIIAFKNCAPSSVWKENTLSSEQILEKGVSCAMDGALIAKQPFYRKKVESALNSLAALYGISQTIHLVTADDGSGKGAALLGALNSL